MRCTIVKITKIEAGKISIPLKVPFITALRRVDTAEDLVIKVHTDDGAIGWGSAPATVVITGDSHASVAAAIKEVMAPQLIGLDIDDREEILARISRSMAHNTSAKAALDKPYTTSSASTTGSPCTVSSAACALVLPQT